ncbi:NAD-dependent epimerase/dehydratase family protein [Pseudonocardia sichuanensis]
MRIAVTGAAGLLGRHVVARAVRAGHDVVATDLPGAPEASGSSVRWRAADLTDLDAVRSVLAGTQGVVHLGGLTNPHHPEPDVHRINVGGSHHVLVAAEEHGLAAVCLASSINAIGGVYSAHPRYDHFPIDEEEHPSYCEDSYSLSKWLIEQQSAAFARRRPDAAFSALRLHGLRADAASARSDDDERARKDLWGWVSLDAAASACLLALRRPTPGHAVYHVVSDRTITRTPSSELAARFYPDVQLRAPLEGNAGFYSTERITADLGWDPAVDHPEIGDAERARQPASSA